MGTIVNGSCVFISLYRDIDARMIVDGDLD